MDLAVKTRVNMGKGLKALRKEGFIPAELYGHGLQNVHLSVPAKEFNKVFKAAGTSTVLTLHIDKEKKSAIIHDIVHNAISGEVAHIDFYQVRMDEKMKAKVVLEFIGVAPAIKELGAILNKSMLEIEVEALPADLPSKLVIDLSSLDALDKSIYVKDIKFPKGVETDISPETPIVTATPPAAEEEVVAPVADVAEVKVETEEKKAERQAVKAEKTTKEDTK